MIHGGWLLIAAAGALGWANGANDISKGVATLVGSGTAGARKALAWGTAWTVLGALLTLVFSGRLIKVFSSTSVFAGAGDSAVMLAAALAALGWVLIATRFALPVSTTHAIVGGSTGAALAVLGPGAAHWTALGQKVALPLLLSPLAALALTMILAPPIHFAMARLHFETVISPRDADSPIRGCSGEAWRKLHINLVPIGMVGHPLPAVINRSDALLAERREHRELQLAITGLLHPYPHRHSRAKRVSPFDHPAASGKAMSAPRPEAAGKRTSAHTGM